MALLIVASAVRAEEQTAAGRVLFDQGRAYLERGDYPKACASFEESYRQGPGGGTLLNLALCNELLGKTATATRRYREAIQAAIRDGRDDRRTFAEEHLARLAPRLSRIRIVVPKESRVPGLVIRLNKEVVAPEAWEQPVSADPGVQRIEGLAPGFVPVELAATIGGDGEQVQVILPRPIRQGATAAPASSAAPRRSGGFWNAYRVSGAAAFGAGVVAAGVAAAFGANALSHDHRSDDLCPSADRCDPGWLDENARALSSARTATTILIVGGALVAGGATLFLLAPSIQSGGTSSGGAEVGLGAAGIF